MILTPLSLGIETENESFTKIIDKNTTIPTKETMPFTTVEDDQRRVRVHFIELSYTLHKLASLINSISAPKITCVE